MSNRKILVAKPSGIFGDINYKLEYVRPIYDEKYPDFIDNALEILQNTYLEHISPVMKRFINSVTQGKSEFDLIEEFLQSEKGIVSKEQFLHYVEQFNDIIEENHENCKGNLIEKWIQFSLLDDLLTSSTMTDRQKKLILRQKDKLIKQNKIFLKIIVNEDPLVADHEEMFKFLKRYVKFSSKFILKLIDVESIDKIFCPTKRNCTVKYLDETNNCLFRGRLDIQFENIVIEMKNKSYSSTDSGTSIFSDLEIRKEHEFYQMILYFICILAQQDENQLASPEPYHGIIFNFADGKLIHVETKVSRKEAKDEAARCLEKLGHVSRSLYSSDKYTSMIRYLVDLKENKN